MQIHDRVALPMHVVLAKVPGLSVAAKCRAVGVSRQAYYYWIRGYSRPNVIQSRRLAKLTGLNADDIRGRTRLTPVKPTKNTRPRRAIVWTRDKRKRSRPAPAATPAPTTTG
jgi:DNA-binding XRE family transcriptional regulator